MTNGATTIDGLTRYLANLRRQHELAASRLADIKRDMDAIEAALQVVRKIEAQDSPEIIDPKKLRGKTQLEALRYIAKKHNGEIKVTYARRLLLQAGLIGNPKNASSIIYNVISGSELFDHVGRGTYRLRSFKPQAKVTPIRTA